MEEEARQRGRQRTRMNLRPHIYCRLHLNLISPQVACMCVHVGVSVSVQPGSHENTWQHLTPKDNMADFKPNVQAARYRLFLTFIPTSQNTRLCFKSSPLFSLLTFICTSSSWWENSEHRCQTRWLAYLHSIGRALTNISDVCQSAGLGPPSSCASP